MREAERKAERRKRELQATLVAEVRRGQSLYRLHHAVMLLRPPSLVHMCAGMPVPELALAGLKSHS